MDTETCNKGVFGWIVSFPIFVFLNQIVINKTEQGRVTYPAAEQQSGAGGLAGGQGEGHGEGLGKSGIFWSWTGKLPYHLSELEIQVKYYNILLAGFWIFSLQTSVQG